MQFKVCKSTATVTGCGKSKPEIEFKVVRVNKTTDKAYRERLCSECRNASRRKPKKLATDLELYNKFDRLMRG